MRVISDRDSGMVHKLLLLYHNYAGVTLIKQPFNSFVLIASVCLIGRSSLSSIALKVWKKRKMV
jgi:hypothetical protein